MPAGAIRVASVSRAPPAVFATEVPVTPTPTSVPTMQNTPLKVTKTQRPKSECIRGALLVVEFQPYGSRGISGR